MLQQRKNVAAKVLLIISILVCFSLTITESFKLSFTASKLQRCGVRKLKSITEPASTTSLSSFHNDFMSSTIFLSAQAQLEAYEKQGVPDIVLPVIVSLVVGTILLPLTARKFQKDRNTRSIKDKGMQQEPEDAAGAYEKFYKNKNSDDK